MKDIKARREVDLGGWIVKWLVERGLVILQTDQQGGNCDSSAYPLIRQGTEHETGAEGRGGTL